MICAVFLRLFYRLFPFHNKSVLTGVRFALFFHVIILYLSLTSSDTAPFVGRSIRPVPMATALQPHFHRLHLSYDFLSFTFQQSYNKILKMYNFKIFFLEIMLGCLLVRSIHFFLESLFCIRSSYSNFYCCSLLIFLNSRIRLLLVSVYCRAKY